MSKMLSICSFFLVISGAYAFDGKSSIATVNYSPATCQKSSTIRSDGVKVATVNCQMGQTCNDGETCCRLGSSISCCTSTENCVDGTCESK
jgi:hypothetical protein